jgi:hypothetical protein
LEVVVGRKAGFYLVAFVLAAAPLAAQWLNYPTPGIPRTPDGKPNLAAPAPKTADGKPDLSGIWTLTTSGSGVSQLKPSEIKPWALKLAQEHQETLNRDSPFIHCLPAGPLGWALAKIAQTPALLLMLREDLTYRQIFLDGRELPKDPNPAWMGYSVGHWEGDTLVVESSGYNDRTWLELGYPHSESLRITERFHRDDFGHITVDATYSDPGAYERPWTVRTAMQYVADTDLLEYVCAENEKDSVHLVGTKSDDTEKAVKLAPDILSKYVGTYEWQSPRGPVDIKVALEDGELALSFQGVQGAPMTALSETTFSALGAYYEFGKNDKGDATYLIFRIAEGDRRADRKK